MKLLEYMKKSNFNKLPPEQRQFMAKLITSEVEQIAKEKDIPVEEAYFFLKVCLALIGKYKKHTYFVPHWQKAEKMK